MSSLAWTAVFVGGGLGAMARYSLAVGFNHDSLFPWTTLGINIAGSFAIGLMWAGFSETGWFEAWGRYLIVIGFLGGFTTFSTFSMDVLTLLEQGRLWLASAYAIGSLLTCIIAVSIGYRLV